MAFNGRFLLNMIHFASRQGADLQELLALSEHSAEVLSQESCKVTDRVYNQVIEQAVSLTGDPFFGLHAGESLNLTAAGLISQISQTSETVKQALEYCCHFANLGCSVLPMSLKEGNDTYKIHLSPNKAWVDQSYTAFRHTADGVLAFSLRVFHSLTQEHHFPLAVYLPWPRPAQTEEYERIFRCALYFDSEEIAMVMEKAQVEAPVISANFDLLRILVAHAEKKSAQIQQKHGFVARIKESLLNIGQKRLPTIDEMAAHLHTSPRTLQRRLQVQGYTYKQLTDELRKEMALSYLERPHLSIGEVAYLLDYADASTFIRSFKRWTGVTPKTYRERDGASL